MLALALLFACGTPSEPPTEEAAEAPAAEAPAPAEAPTWTTFGEAFPDGDAVAAAALLDDPEPFVGQSLVVEGRVADVCQKAGCWMVIADGDRTMRVMMKDHAFAVPKDCDGEVARVAGTVVAKDVDAATVAHFEGEAAKPEVMPEKAPGRTYQLVASAVQLNR